MRWMACVAMIALVAGCGAEQEAPPEADAGEETSMEIHEHRSGEWSPALTDKEKAVLFSVAEDTLRWCTGDRREPLSLDAYALTPKLREDAATFVTLKVGERLRGCIGSLTPVAALAQSVHDNAVNAALRDTRFRPVTSAEVDGIDIHISILSPIRSVPSLDAFKIGEHGIILERGRHRAVYLPEVAVEQNWTKEETLSSLSMKAGLPPDGWREGAAFKVFSSVALSKE